MRFDMTPRHGGGGRPEERHPEHDPEVVAGERELLELDRELVGPDHQHEDDEEEDEVPLPDVARDHGRTGGPRDQHERRQPEADAQ
jgi:hypothetical protein